jgi:hypothetical protein
MKCKICQEEITFRSLAMHLKWKHSTNTNEYINQYGEFHPKKLNIKSNNPLFKCLECNAEFPDQRNLMFHITKNHKIEKKKYIIKHYFNDTHPVCKCGCNQKTTFLPSGKNDNGDDMWFREYIKGHWDWVKPGYHAHSDETKNKMRLSAIERLKKEKGLYKGISQLEIQLVDFIKEIYTGPILLNDTALLSGKEIDIYLPELKIAIEFNGTYYHSDLFKTDKNYHLNKTKECNRLGIKLIHIWDSDWIYNQEIIKSMLRYQLKTTLNKVYARKCDIREVSKKDSVIFLKHNHLQGNAISKYNIGLYYNNELISLMTFSKLRKNLKQNHVEGKYELLRFCNKLNTNVIGGASKLFQYFVKKYSPTNVVSYANRDWSLGELYQKLNMNPLSSTPPGYHWYKSKIRYNRFNFRKDILVSQGEDASKTEYEIMLSRGYYKVWNTGNYKFEYVKP